MSHFRANNDSTVSVTDIHSIRPSWGRSIAIGYVVTAYLLAGIWIKGGEVDSISVMAFVCAPLALPLAMIFMLVCSVLPDGQQLPKTVAKIALATMVGTALFAAAERIVTSHLFARRGKV